MQVCDERVQAKFRDGVQTVAFGTDPLVAANAVNVIEPQAWVAFQMGVTLWARSLHAPLRLFAFFVLTLVSRFLGFEVFDPLAINLLGTFPIRAASLAIFRFSCGFGSPFGIWSSLIQIVLDSGLSFTTWYILLKYQAEGKDERQTVRNIATVEMCVCFYNLLLLIILVAITKCCGRVFF